MCIERADLFVSQISVKTTQVNRCNVPQLSEVDGATRNSSIRKRLVQLYKGIHVTLMTTTQSTEACRITPTEYRGEPRGPTRHCLHVPMVARYSALSHTCQLAESDVQIVSKA